ncbi:MAG TPA: rhodanese-like domain-containing protein [Candidatus Eisenbacteria bacterium]|nr:rhodanese-like domain-containing protein [Candidatus Eisenbacteria bacterium]
MARERLTLLPLLPFAFTLLVAPAAGAADTAPASAPAATKADETAPVWRDLKPEEIISADELRKLQLEKKSFLLYDARSKSDYDTAHIEGATLPMPHKYYTELSLYSANIISQKPDTAAYLRDAMRDTPKTTPIVVYCNSHCQASTAVLLKLKSLGFTDVRAMKEGIQAWEQKEYPVARSAPAEPKAG